MFDIEFDSLTLVERAETLAYDASVVDEKILIITLPNKILALFIIEPLHGSFCHSAPLLSKIFYAVRINALAK